MRRFLFWLLVSLLPIGGLLSGVWLLPMQQPLWQLDLEFCHVLGTVDGGNTLLSTESDGAEQFVVGRYTKSGKERFRHQLHPSIVHGENFQIKEATLSEDKRYVILCGNRLGSTRRQVLLYDWQNQVVAHRVSPPAWWSIVRFAALCGDVLLVQADKCYLWKLNEPPDAIKGYDNHDRERDFVGTSRDGRIIVSHGDYHEAVDPFSCLVFRDIDQPKAYARIVAPERSILRLLNMPGKLSVTVLELHINQRFDFRYYLRRYRLQNGTYHIEYERNLSDLGHSCSKGDHLAFIGTREEDPWHKRLVNLFGKSLVSRFDKHWPAVQLHWLDPVTGVLLWSNSFPKSHQQTLRNGQLQYVPEVPCMIISSSEFIECWALFPLTRYLPLAGFITGLFISLLAIYIRFHCKRAGWRQPSESGVLVPGSSTHLGD